MQLDSMFISNCNNTLHVSDAFCVLYMHLFMLALYLAACHTPEAATTVFKCSWGWAQKSSETCGVLGYCSYYKHTAKLHHVGSLYILTYDSQKLKHKIHQNVLL